MNDGVVFATPWFQIVAKNLERSTGPHYSLQMNPAAAVAARPRAERTGFRPT
jgi:hypothetical protein